MPIQPLHAEFRGNLPIVPTPFHASGELAVKDIEKMVDYYERCRVEGLTILGVMGEAHKPSAAETSACVDEFVRCAKGRWRSSLASSPTARSAELGNYAVSRGADAVMLLP